MNFTWIFIFKFEFDVIIFYTVRFWGNVYFAWLCSILFDFDITILAGCDVILNMFYFDVHKSLLVLTLNIDFEVGYLFDFELVFVFIFSSLNLTWIFIFKFEFDVIIYYPVWFWVNVNLAWLCYLVLFWHDSYIGWL